MKIILALGLLLSLSQVSLGQEIFTNKQQALDWLKKTFSGHFLKTTVYRDDDKKKTAYTYDYEIGEKRILIIKKTEGQTSDSRYTVPYEDIAEVFFLQKNDYFKTVSGIGFKPRSIETYLVSYGEERKKYDDHTAYATSASFPFEMKKDDPLFTSLIRAIGIISRENKSQVSIEKQKTGDALLAKDKINALASNDPGLTGKQLPPYGVFTSENTPINLYDHVDKNRQYKDKPTLLITWGHWCYICIRQIDTLLNNGIALKYNVILINRESAKDDFSTLKEKIRSHVPDYNKNTILLFDRNNQFEVLDKGGTPYFLWLDKNLKIVYSFNGYGIKTPTIVSMLADIEK